MTRKYRSVMCKCSMYSTRCVSADDLSRPGQMGNFQWEILSRHAATSSSRSLRHGSVADMNYRGTVAALALTLIFLEILILGANFT